MGNNKQEPSLRTKVVIELLRAEPRLSMSEIGRMVGLTRQRIGQIDRRYRVRKTLAQLIAETRQKAEQIERGLR